MINIDKCRAFFSFLEQSFKQDYFFFCCEAGHFNMEAYGHWLLKPAPRGHKRNCSYWYLCIASLCQPWRFLLGYNQQRPSGNWAADRKNLVMPQLSFLFKRKQKLNHCWLQPQGRSCAWKFLSHLCVGDFLLFPKDKLKMTTKTSRAKRADGVDNTVFGQQINSWNGGNMWDFSKVFFFFFFYLVQQLSLDKHYFRCHYFLYTEYDIEVWNIRHPGTQGGPVWAGQFKDSTNCIVQQQPSTQTRQAHKQWCVHALNWWLSFLSM